VGSNGSAEPAGLGTVTITATFGSYSGSSELEVVPVVLDDFTISPNAMNTGVGVVQNRRSLDRIRMELPATLRSW
jgi:hypothetical protein